MATLPRVPPGRAGRLWITRRLAVATSAAELLDQKVRVLRQQAERFMLLVDSSREAWTQSCRDAEAWALRAALVGGQAALRAAIDRGGARVALTWESAMGVSYPSRGRVLVRDTADVPIYGPANEEAIAAHRHALEAAVQHAAALAALDAIELELAATRRRLRAVSDHWIPRLESALTAISLALEETERAERLGLQWAQHAHPDHGRSGPVHRPGTLTADDQPTARSVVRR